MIGLDIGIIKQRWLKKSNEKSGGETIRMVFHFGKKQKKEEGSK